MKSLHYLYSYGEIRNNDSLYQTKNPLRLLQLKNFYHRSHLTRTHVSEILQMNLHEIHPELVKQKTFNICTTMPKISEIKEKCRAVEPPLTPHTHQPPTISIPTLTLAACWKCFVLFMSHHTIPSFGSGWRELEENLKKVPLQNCVYNNKVQRDSNCVTTLTWGGR